MTSRPPLEIRQLSSRRYTDHIIFKVEIDPLGRVWHLRTKDPAEDVNDLFGWWLKANHEEP